MRSAVSFAAEATDRAASRDTLASAALPCASRTLARVMSRARPARPRAPGAGSPALTRPRLVRPARRGMHVALQETQPRLDPARDVVDAAEPRRARVTPHRADRLDRPFRRAVGLPGEGEGRDGRRQEGTPEPERAQGGPGALECVDRLREVVRLVPHDAEPVQRVGGPPGHVADLGAMVRETLPAERLGVPEVAGEVQDAHERCRGGDDQRRGREPASRSRALLAVSPANFSSPAAR